MQLAGVGYMTVFIEGVDFYMMLSYRYAKLVKKSHILLYNSNQFQKPMPLEKTHLEESIGSIGDRLVVKIIMVRKRADCAFFVGS